MKTLIVTALILLTTTGGALAFGPPSLHGHHQLSLHAGMWNQSTSTRSEVGTGGVSATVGTSGGMGGLSYGYWMREGFAITVGVTGMLSDIETNMGSGAVQSNTGSVTKILIGARQYFPASTYDTRFRPFASASFGPFVGHQQETRAGLSIAYEARSETAVGGQVGLGSDVRIGSRFLATPMIAYNLMTDFDRAIGGSRNYSGPEFSFGFGVVIGRM